jgi:hypothetical protein
MEKLFARGKFEDVEQRTKFLSCLQLKIKMLHVMKDYADNVIHQVYSCIFFNSSSSLSTL